MTLIEALPETVWLGEKQIPIQSDFRVILRVYEPPDGLTEGEQGAWALRLFYGGLPEDLETAMERLSWFIRCGRPETEGAGGKPSRPDFSFAHDAPLIYAAFLAQYRIDLYNVDFLHWWKFRALFDGLHGEHFFSEVRKCRAVNLAEIKDKALKRYYTEMQKRYALPLPKQAQAQADALVQALLGGGDVAAALK